MGVFFGRGFFLEGGTRSVLGSETYFYIGWPGGAGLASNRICCEEYLRSDLGTLVDGYRVGVIPWNQWLAVTLFFLVF